VLNVSAVEKSTGLEGNITITNERNRLTKEEIARIVAEAERYRLDELNNRERIQAKSALETFCFNIKENIEKKKDAVVKKCTEIMEWLDKSEPADKEEFEKKKREVEDLLNGIPKLVASSTSKVGNAGPSPKRGSQTSGDEENKAESSKRAKK